MAHHFCLTKKKCSLDSKGNAKKCFGKNSFYKEVILKRDKPFIAQVSNFNLVFAIAGRVYSLFKDVSFIGISGSFYGSFQMLKFSKKYSIS